MKHALAVLLLLAGLASFPRAAAAQAPRHIDFTQALIAVNGKPMLTEDAKHDPMTLGYACVSALEAVMPDDRSESGADKFAMDALARKIYGAKDAVLSVEDIAKIKERVGKYWGPAVIGAAWPLLDPSVNAPAAH